LIFAQNPAFRKRQLVKLIEQDIQLQNCWYTQFNQVISKWCIINWL